MENKDLNDLRVIQHNNLIQSIAEMSATSIKLMETCIAYIDDDFEDTVFVDKKNIFAVLDYQNKNKYNELKRELKIFQKSTLKIYEEVNDAWTIDSISLISRVKFGNKLDKVLVKFNADILDLIKELKGNFTQYNLIEIARFRGKYSIILFRLLIMKYNQFKNYNLTTKRTKKQLEELRNPVFEVEYLKEITNTKRVKSYNKISNFERRVVSDAVEEINKNTRLNVKTEKIYDGRKVIAFKFYISEKVVAPLDYKENDTKYLETLEFSKEEKEKLYIKATTSKYTKLLLENMFLSAYDIADIEIMSSLYINVYLKYEKLESKRGLTAVEKHLKYIVSKQKPFSKDNIVKYLSVTIDDYLNKLKNEGDF